MLHSGFDSKGDNDFFQAFDNVKEGQQSGGSDGFDANAFGATAWGESTTTTESSARVQDNAENLLKMTLDNFDGSGEKAKKDDVHRLKPRRKREGGGRSRGNRDVEGKVDSENAVAGGEKKERRSRKEGHKGEEDKESRQRKRSTSRTRRKARGQRSSTTKTIDDKGNSGGDVDKKISKSGSIRNIFNRKQGSEDA